IADEPTTGLDVTIQAQILDLMKHIQAQLGTAIILITHDLGVVAKLADRVMVMYAGKVVESGVADDIYYNPQHPYTRALLQSVPKMHGERKGDLMAIPGTPPDLFSPPKGCAFAPRCSDVRRICLEEDPEPSEPEDHHSVTCWLSHPMAKVAVGCAQAGGGAR
ncbi:MAG TPA: ABC transporter ATP-binding protein, partial [Firmicutes bacterium]|nr:ABC transporter ATP-binding protein [Bacillota bacterium]